MVVRAGREGKGPTAGAVGLSPYRIFRYGVISQTVP
jgi:hypothetical protein